MEKLISLLFLARDITHREHLKTRSYAQHMALGSFYSAIVDDADAIAEAYQGQHGIIENIAITGYVSSTPVIEVLQDHVSWIKANRYSICEKEDTPIQNLIDNAVATYLSAIYKLRFLG